MAPITKPLDVIIVGAGISGIGMAVHLAEKCPGMTFGIIDRRARTGGTWDLFRYPGIRSDSDMYTLGFAFEPWRHQDSIAQGATILDYLDKVVDERGLRDKISFGQKVVSANWDSASSLWNLVMEDEQGRASTASARFLYLGVGYYDQDSPYNAEIPGMADFGGAVIHPQFWPADFDYTGKRVVVIGSGATAATMVPALTDKAAHVIMLQRTPSWYIQRPSRDKIANFVRKLMPETWAYALVRAKNIVMQDILFKKARNNPAGVANYLTEQTKESLGDAWNAKDYTPPYNPWEQRLCIVPDGDMFKAIKAGKASVVTGRIKTVDQTGLLLEDGSHIDADVIVTATGLRLAVAGKIALSLDGTPLDLSQRWYYRNCMFSDVPNFAALFGYLNAGWTLRVDIVADWLARLFGQMKVWNVDVVTPVLADPGELTENAVFDLFSSGYLQRDKQLLPKIAHEAPWRLSMDYRADRKEMQTAPFDDGVLKFERSVVPTPAQ